MKFVMPPVVPAKKERVSPRGCTIKPGDIIYRRTTYRIARGTSPTKDDGQVFKSVMDAIMYVATEFELASATFRVIEVPPGEPWDFDGDCVAELCCERGL